MLNSFIDLHIHGHTAGAVSKYATIDQIELKALEKGLTHIGTGDIWNPEWFKETTNYLKPQGGFLQGRFGLNFIPTTEVECNWQGNSVHLLIIFNSLEDVKALRALVRQFSQSIDTQGRPNFSLSPEKLTGIITTYKPLTEVIPAHIFTPWNGVFGEKNCSTLQEAFGSKTDKIRMIECGLSADPVMCSQFLDSSRLTQVSFSDNHSATTSRLGREATILSSFFETTQDLLALLRDKTKISTIEYPHFAGKYAYCGHRNCAVSYSPKECENHYHKCASCLKPVTEGALHRQLTLSARSPSKNATIQPHQNLLPLFDLLESFLSKQTTMTHIDKLKTFRNEYEVLLDVPEDVLLNKVPERVVEAIMLNRAGKVPITPGFDNSYGKILLGSDFTEANTKPPEFVEADLTQWT